MDNWLFADDTALAQSSDTFSDLQIQFNNEVKKVQNWLLANKLSVHYVGKSQYMLINNNINTSLEDDNFQLKMGNLLEIS